MRDWPVYVVIPALDEEASLPHVLSDLRALGRDLAEIIVVDNGSRDRTPEVAQAGGATVLHESQRGYGAACQLALQRVAKSQAVRKEEDAIVVFLDADYSDYPEDLESLVEPIQDSSADFVLGSRLLYSGSRAAVPLPSRVGNFIASTILYWLYGVRFTDLGPFRAIRLSALDAIEMQDRDWGWTIEMQLRACQLELGIREVPVRYRPRYAGTSKISGSLKGAVLAGTKILWVLARHSLTRRTKSRWLVS
jgi:glycosyltransferase involved in cell wall biosynthesis